MLEENLSPYRHAIWLLALWGALNITRNRSSSAVFTVVGVISDVNAIGR